MAVNPLPDIQSEVDDPNDYGIIIAENVTFKDYMLRYAEGFCEWVDGAVIKMSPVHLLHDRLSDYLRKLLDAYFALRSIGRVVGAPFVMKLAKSAREPDLQVILNEHTDRLMNTMVKGAADICIEVVSPESVARDYGKKFEEYEKGGVPEYWLFDPHRKSVQFHRLNAGGIYEPVMPDAEGHYTTPLLPGFRLHVPTLWQDELPDIIQIVEYMKKMLAE